MPPIGKPIKLSLTAGKKQIPTGEERVILVVSQAGIIPWIL